MYLTPNQLLLLFNPSIQLFQLELFSFLYLVCFQSLRLFYWVECIRNMWGYFPGFIDYSKIMLWNC